MSHSQASSPAGGTDFVIRVVQSLKDFERADWDRLSGASRSSGCYNPFVSYAFLSALEASGSATRATGWMGQHLRLERADGTLAGASPCYLKNHSQGEYVFDHGWADAFERAGGQYYPKLQVSVPFTPATGPRLLVCEDFEAEAVRRALAGGLKLLTERLGVSSVHVTFAPEDEMRLLESEGFLHRTDQQFHFINHGYRDYDDFLDTLASRKRKALRKERSAALQSGIEVEWLSGSGLTETVWDDFFAFYMDTGGRKWGRPYLTREFFSLIGQEMADDIVLIMARRNGRYIAGALNLAGSETIFGRHWGCVEDHRFLHFELCYHQAIDYAIAHKLKKVEAGAQGQHKLARGYVPVTTHSAHFIPHSGFRRAVDDYLRHERREVEHIAEVLEAHAPFKKA